MQDNLDLLLRLAMISGISRIWIKLEINSQNTNAIGGSNCSFWGASRFQPNHKTIQTKIARKNPIVPTRSVIHTASLSSRPTFSATSLLTFRRGRRRFRSSSTERGFGEAVCVVTGMAPAHTVAATSRRKEHAPLLASSHERSGVDKDESRDGRYRALILPGVGDAAHDNDVALLHGDHLSAVELDIDLA
jgi:hypothetical protein